LKARHAFSPEIPKQEWNAISPLINTLAAAIETQHANHPIFACGSPEVLLLKVRSYRYPIIVAEWLRLMRDSCANSKARCGMEVQSDYGKYWWFWADCRPSNGRKLFGPIFEKLSFDHQLRKTYQQWQERALLSKILRRG
jgi:hypothetical protein